MQKKVDYRQNNRRSHGVKSDDGEYYADKRSRRRKLEESMERRSKRFSNPNIMKRAIDPDDLDADFDME